MKEKTERRLKKAQFYRRQRHPATARKDDLGAADVIIPRKLIKPHRRNPFIPCAPRKADVVHVIEGIWRRTCHKLQRERFRVRNCLKDLREVSESNHVLLEENEDFIGCEIQIENDKQRIILGF